MRTWPIMACTPGGIRRVRCGSLGTIHEWRPPGNPGRRALVYSCRVISIQEILYSVPVWRADLWDVEEPACLQICVHGRVHDP